MAPQRIPSPDANGRMEGLKDLPTELIRASFQHLDVVDSQQLADTLRRKETDSAYRDRLIARCDWVLRVHHTAQLFGSHGYMENDILVPTFAGLSGMGCLQGELEAEARLSTYEMRHEYIEAVFKEQPAASGEAFRDDNSTIPRSRKSPPDPTSWGVNLDGSLLWLHQRPDQTALPFTENQSSHAQLRSSHLQQEVSRIAGLTLPPGFIAFISRPEVYQRVSSSQGWYFSLGDPRENIPSDPSPKPRPRLLIKVRVRGQENEQCHGYMVLFHQDPEQKVCTYLYLDTNGSHCVLALRSNYYEEQEREPDDNEVVQLQSPALAGFTFEEYLYAYYFDELIYTGAPLDTPGLQQYIENMYVPRQLCSCKDCSFSGTEAHLWTECRCSSCVTEGSEDNDDHDSSSSEYRYWEDGNDFEENYSQDD